MVKRIRPRKIHHIIFMKPMKPPDNNFRQQLRLNLDNCVLKIYKYNEATGKIEIVDIVESVIAGKDRKRVEISMLYDKNILIHCLKK